MNTHPKPLWLEIVTSNTMAALVTVVIGGIIGQLILTCFQNRAKQREQSTIDYKQRLERQQETMQHAYEIVVRSTVSANNLMQLTQPEFEIESRVKEDQESLRKHKLEIIQVFNDTAAEWRIEQKKIGLLFRYYYGVETISHWEEIKSSVNKLRDCADRLYGDYSRDPEKRPGQGELCTEELNDIDKKLDSLATSIESLKATPR